MNFLKKATLTMFMAAGISLTNQDAAFSQEGHALKQATNKMAAANPTNAIGNFTKNSPSLSHDVRGPTIGAENKTELATDEKGKMYDVTSLTDAYNVRSKDCKWKFDNIDGTKMATMILEIKDIDGNVLSLSIHQKLINSNDKAVLETAKGEPVCEHYLMKRANGDILNESYKLKGEKAIVVHHTNKGQTTYKTDESPAARFYEMAPVFDANTKFKASAPAQKTIITGVQKLIK